MRYHVKDTDMYFDDCEEAVDYCLDDDYHWDDEWTFKDYVNEAYGSIEICGRTFYAYEILEGIDDNLLDDLHRDFCNDENDRDREDALYDLRNADAGEEIECQSYTIVVVEDEEELNEEDQEDCIEATRRYYDERSAIAKEIETNEKNMEKDMISLFQVIGG